MSGARFIMNSRYFHIAQPGEKLSKHALSGSHVGSLVNYCGTRESVALNISDEFKNNPATEKQIKTINNLLEELNFNTEEDMPFEYQDYIKAPTKQNASELISRLSEIVYMSNADYGFNEASNLVEYAAERPGVVKVGEHGLFSSHANVDLEAAKQEISTHKGNIWTDVFSLRREDADALGYDSQTPWRNLIMSHIDDIAKAHKIKPENLRWYGAMHNTSYHPHIHLFVYSTDVKEGYLSEKGIKKLKSEFVTDIFKDELMHTYQQKDYYKDQLNIKIKEELNNLLNNPEQSFENQKLYELANKMLTLSQKYKGKAVYGYQTKEVKALINDIQRSLVNNNSTLSNLYQEWCNQQFNIETLYIKDPNREYPIENNATFKPIKNEILRQAQALRNSYQHFMQSSFDDYNENYKNIKASEQAEKENKAVENALWEEDYNNQNTYKEYTTDELLSLANEIPTRNGEICRKLADCYNYGNDMEQNISQAVMWYGIAADEFQDGIASYKLGQIYLHGSNDIEIDTELGNYYCKQAYYIFKEEIANGKFFDDLENGTNKSFYQTDVSKTDAYKEYLIGRMYLNGDGIEQNYYKANQAFSLSSENGYEKANYVLGNQYYYGIGVNKDIDKAISAFEKTELSSSVAYKLGILYEQKSDIPQDKEKALLYYQISAELGNTSACYRLGHYYLENNDIKQSINYFKESAKQGNPDASYQLGNIYKSDKYGYKDDALSNKHFTSALSAYQTKFVENPTDGDIAMRIGTFYHYGLGVEHDIEKAISWYIKAVELGNQKAQQKMDEAQQTKQLSVMAVATTACHFGKIINTETIATAKNRYVSDKKLLRKEKIQKIHAGHAIDDNGQTYDY